MPNKIHGIHRLGSAHVSQCSLTKEEDYGK
jgi:hypothetical protein